MYTLDNFYKSREWRGLLQVIKNDRVNDSGEIICEYCGKPITKGYDCIGHHTVALTEENVNDSTISLNPQLIQLLHIKCHNKIHDKLGYSNRKVYLVYGSPLSGKSRFVADSMIPGDLVLDMDNIWQCVSGCERYVKPNRLKSVVFGVRDNILDMIRYRRGKWTNAWIIGGYPFEAERHRLCDSLGAEEIYIESTMGECLERLSKSGDGRNIAEWVKYISDWWSKYNPHTPPT